MTFAEDCLTGRTVLVTGASSGLGRASAIAISRCGARVVLNGRDENRLEQTRLMLSGDGHELAAAELADVDGAAEFVRALAKRLGAFHGIYHAAGVTSTVPIRFMKQRLLEDVYRPSVYATYGIARAAAQKGVMSDEGGSIVLMSSISAVKGSLCMTAYSGAKRAVDGMLRSLSVEMAPKNIRVNSIICGSVYTEMYEREAALIGESSIEATRTKHLLGFGEPNDIAQAVIFLLTDASRWITGTSMTVDGGVTAW
jgi:NAD(P)-dependent dehydrogenase (short-subunit alcohol dehydrogenase family)